MALAHFITHPEVTIDPAIPVPDWTLSPRGLARMRAMLAEPWVASIGAVFSSTERKALDGAAILATDRGLSVQEYVALGENDRSATGYLPKEEFERTADAFFAQSAVSIRGWERAIDSQARIVAAMEVVFGLAPPGQDIAIIAHGGVGALYLCHLWARPISRAADQPANGGGNRFVLNTIDRHPSDEYGPWGWQPIGLAGDGLPGD